MNRKERIRQNKQLPKQDIIFMTVKFESLTQRAQVLTMLRTNYQALKYPFGNHSKIKYGEIIQGMDGYFMVASVCLTPFDYMYKCVHSDFELLQNACAQWVKVNHPNLQQQFYNLQQQIKNERATLIATQNIKKGNIQKPDQVSLFHKLVAPDFHGVGKINYE